MGKKHQKTQKEIRQYIYDDYIFNRELESTDDVLKHLNLLVDNNIASRISGKEDMAYTRVSRYKIASKMLCGYNKSLKEFKRTPLKHEISEEQTTANDDAEMIKLAKEGLDFGTYYVDLGNEKHDDYAILKVFPADAEDSYVIGYELYFVGYRHKKYKNKFFKMVDKYEKKEDSKKKEFVVDMVSGVTKEVTFKSFEKLVFTNKQKILDYIDNWVKCIPIYYKYEMTPKLSILLYGEPGTGKSSFGKALAKYLGITAIGTLNSDYFAMSDDNYRRRPRAYAWDKIIYSLDDIDCYVRSREDDKSNDNGKILSSLLEFLDNPPTFYYKAKDGLYYPVSIVVATTNYYDRLDDAVKRYGRFDLKVEMKSFTEEQAEEMCQMYDLHLEDVYDGTIDEDFTISPAYLQALCMENIDNSMKGRSEDY